MTRLSPVCPQLFPLFSSLHRCLGAVCLVTVGACATAAAPPAQTPGRAASKIESGSAAAEAAAAWGRRGEPAELARAIAILSAEAEREPTSVTTKLQLAEAHHLMAQSIVVLGWKEQGEPGQHLAASAAAALAALALRDGPAAHALAEHTLPELNAVSDAQSGAALYWFALATYEADQRAGYSALIVDQALVQRVTDRAASLAPEVDHGGPFRVLASLAAHPADPTLRDLSRAREAARRALAIDAGFAANTLALLEHVAVPAQDRAAIVDTLQPLTERSPDSPENVLGQALAQQLAEHIEERLE